MTRIESETAAVKAKAEEVFGFLSDLNNLLQIMPETVSDWQSSAGTCSFKIRGLARVSFKLAGATPPGEVLLASDEGSPFPFTIHCFVDGAAGDGCSARTVFKAAINPVMAMLLEKPLAKFFNSLVWNLQKKYGGPS